MKKQTNTRTIFIMGILLGLIVGVPIIITLVYYFSEESTSLVYVLLTTLVVLVLIASIIIFYRDRILESIFGSHLKELNTIGENVVDSLDLISQQEFSKGKDKTRETVSSILAYASWLNYKRWVFNICLGLIVAFSTLIGTSLLHQQNQLIQVQNQFFREQISQQQLQIQAQEKVENQNIRNQAIEQIYDDKGIYSPRVKSEAVKTFVEVEKQILGYTKNNLGVSKRYINLTEVNLNDAWLDNSELSQVFFTITDLNRADFTSSNLKDIRYMGSFLNNSVFSAATLDSIEFYYCEMDSSDFAGAAFANKIIFRGCRMPYSNFSGGLTWGFEGLKTAEILFEDCDLRYAKMDALYEGNHVTIKNSNVYEASLPIGVNIGQGTYRSKKETSRFYETRKIHLGYKFDFAKRE